MKQQQKQLKSVQKSIFKIITLPFKPIFSIYSIFKELCKRNNRGELSKMYNRRRFEPYLQNLDLTQENLGFTNQILYQKNQKTINFYVPVYITNKIKSIQDISVQNLTGNISCAMIVSIFYGDLPKEIVKKLENSITIQLNRGEPINLREDGMGITFKRQEKSKFLIFTIRKVFSAFLNEETLWSPFQLIELVISVTFNTVTISQKMKENDNIDCTKDYCPDKQYKISFNCMRNIDPIPITYALDCAFGVYDLAEKRLEAYHTKHGTLSQIQNALNEQKKKEQDQQLNLVPIPDAKFFPRQQTSQVKKQAPQKLEYFQYTHFIIPLYKYPGNALATIFIPIFLLALVSLAIFFQEPQLSSRIGAIATMILGYIALIPSIKEQLPPSARLTVIQLVVYIQTMCCLLCLYESFSIEDEEYTFVWYENYTFLLCLFTHISTFFFIVGLYVLHKLKWQPSYNCKTKIAQIKPADRQKLWDNPFCDEVFVKYNKAINQGQYEDKKKESLLVRPFIEEKLIQSLRKKQSKESDQNIKDPHRKKLKKE